MDAGVSRRDKSRGVSEAEKGKVKQWLGLRANGERGTADSQEGSRGQEMSWRGDPRQQRNQGCRGGGVGAGLGTVTESHESGLVTNHLPKRLWKQLS